MYTAAHRMQVSCYIWISYTVNWLRVQVTTDGVEMGKDVWNLLQARCS